MKNRLAFIKKTFSFPKLSWVLIWIVISFIGCYFRLYPLRTHVPDEIKDKATMIVVMKLKSEIVIGSHTLLFPSFPGFRPRPL